MGRPRKSDTPGVKLEKKKRPPAATPEARENELIALAYDLVEKRLIEGTATSQETTHFLKMGSPTMRLEKERMEKQNKLLAAKTEALESAKRTEELFTKAIDALRQYNGQSKIEKDSDEHNY